MAKRLGLSGIGIAQYYPQVSDLPSSDFELINAVIIKPESIADLEETARKVRKRCELLMVHGGNYDINRAACENNLVDVLCHPELGRKDSGLDHICAKAANENNVAIEINFREILESYKRHRVFVISAIKKNIKICEKYDAPMITASGSVSKWGMRAGRELAAVSHLLGLDISRSLASVSDIPKEIVMQNRERLAERKWEGVGVVGNG